MDIAKSKVSLKKTFVILIVQLCIASVLFVLYNKPNFMSIYFFDNFALQTNTKPTHNPQLIILLWTWPFGYTFPLNQCPPRFNTSGCLYTQDKRLKSSADAVILHHREISCSRENLPPTPRPPNQYWVWMNLESPSNTPCLELMDNLMNLTMSYRSDSDIFTPYGWLEENIQEENFTVPTKTKLIAWTISNWNPGSKRALYYDQLKQYVPIDVYGSHGQSLSNSEQQRVLSLYKFYFAFENSVHEDYITEKLWRNSFMSGCVPIVLGPSRQNYERFIPKDSFIHVEDFSTARELASYILQLDKDDKAYQKYFHWRKRLHSFQYISLDIHYCKICKALKEAPRQKTVASLAEWYK